MISLDGIQVHHGDCLDVLRTLPDCSVDACITDPPYGLSDLKPAQVTAAIVAWASGDRENVPDARGFMGRSWDAFVPPPAVWDECYRVLKPGGHIAAFAGSRTYDLMGLSIRLAGFEIRDGLQWLYGSGFPKSLDVSKAIDKARDDRAEIHVVVEFLRSWLSAKPDWAAIDVACGCPNTRQKFFSRSTPGMASRCPTWEQWIALKNLFGFGDEMDAEVWRLNGRKGAPGEAWGKREVIGERTTGIGTGRGAVAYIGDSDNRDITAPATDAAREWSGWGTALKPAHEPIVLARKPLSGTVSANVLQFGTGALNIDATRVGSASGLMRPERRGKGDTGGWANYTQEPGQYGTPDGQGRWPANVLLTHAPDCDDSACQPGCPVSELDAQSGISKDGVAVQRNRSGVKPASVYGKFGTTTDDQGYGGQGGASRYFPSFRYQAKAGKAERPKVDGVAHSTVKPIAVMSWLVKLLTPPGGTVLEPFAGSGTTVEACIDEGFHVIAVEREAEYLPLIQHRVDRALARRNVTVDAPMDLFTEFEEHAS